MLEQVRASAPIDYAAALSRQNELSLEGRSGWFLFESLPVVTLGTRADGEQEIPGGAAALEAFGSRILKVDRGGLATFHGPGQIVGFPYGALEAFTGDPRGVRVFLESLQAKIVRFAESYGHRVETNRPGHDAGVWIRTGDQWKKLCAFGMKFSRAGIKHGFALNLWADPAGAGRGFSLINPCGEAGGAPAFLFERKPSTSEIETSLDALSKILCTEGKIA